MNGKGLKMRVLVCALSVAAVVGSAHTPLPPFNPKLFTEQFPNIFGVAPSHGTRDLNLSHSRFEEELLLSFADTIELIVPEHVLALSFGDFFWDIDDESVADETSSAATNPSQTSAIPVSVSLSAASESAFDIAFAFDNWLLLLDHEGESFAALPISQIDVFQHLNPQLSADEPALSTALAPDSGRLGQSPFGGKIIEVAALRRVLLDDEDIAVLSQIYDAEVTASIATRAAQPELAMDGYEDR